MLCFVTGAVVEHDTFGGTVVTVTFSVGKIGERTFGFFATDGVSDVVALTAVSRKNEPLEMARFGLEQTPMTFIVGCGSCRVL